MRLKLQWRFIPFLLGIYICSLAFTDLWVVPGLSRKFQLPEVVFLLTIFSVLWTWRKIFRKPFRLRSIDMGLLSLPLVCGLSVVIAPGQSTFLEVLGLGYLWLVYWLFSRYINQGKGGGLFLLNAIWWLGGVIGVISICSVLLTWQELIPVGFLAEWKLLPYLGWVIRVSGFAFSPNLWATTIEFCILLLLGAWRQVSDKRLYFSMLFLLQLALLLTFSKSIVAFVAVLGLIQPGVFQVKKYWKAASVGFGVVALLFYIVASHVLILSKADPNYAILKEESYLSRQILWQCFDFEVVAATYTELKVQAIEAFKYSHGMGVGGGQFINFVSAQQEKGAYPSYLPLYDPHSTYFGLLAEEGILGVLALALSALFIVSVMMKIVTTNTAGIDAALFWGAKAYLLLMAIEAVAVDVLNFRTLWVALGIIGAIYLKYDNKYHAEG